MSPTSSALHSYRQTQVQGGTPLERVVMLYDGAIRHMNAARDAMDRQDIPARRDAISRALAIVGELQATLDLERGGEIATTLDRLYDFVTSRLMDATMKKDPRPIDECRRVFETLREGWRTIAEQAAPGSAA
jgi:flagellar secretion chaperone FliS